jgi:hypothetical protein
MNKTLVGKNGFLFLINDSCRELEVHCNNVNLVNYEYLNRYSFINFCLIVFPNKSLIYKEYLPDNYKVKYRTGVKNYRKFLKNKLIDSYKILKDEEDIYYKTDTHINMKGAYIVYKHFIEELNKLYDLHIEPKEVNLLNKKCILSELNLGIGDMLWKDNLGDQIVEDNIDSFYYSDEIEYIYYNHKIMEEDKIRILDYNLMENNSFLKDSIIDWNMISNYILYQKNICKNNYKVIIFYDSFLTSTLSLYLELFQEVYMIKSVYNNDIIQNIKPDYVFEFRVERFLF